MRWSTICSTTTLVAPAGPPSVMTQTWSKTWKLLIRLMTSTKKLDGVRSGRVMWRKRAQRPAPSTAAAS